MANKQLRKAFSQLDITKQDKDYLIPAMLGFMIAGRETVEVTNRPGYVYARIRSNLNEVVQVFNDKVSPVYDLPVLLVRDPNNLSRYKVDGRDVGRYENWGTTSSFLPAHADQHSFTGTPGTGGDVVWVYSRQFTPLLVYPSGTYGADMVMINGYTIQRDEGWAYAGGTGTPSFSPYKPTGSSAAMVLLYLDGAGNPQLTAGPMFSSSITGTSAIVPYIPEPPTSSAMPLAAVRLVTGTSAISWDNIYDLRFFPEAGGGGGHTIQKNGVSFDNRLRLNFIGDAFAVSDDLANNATVVSGTLAGGGGGGGSIAVFDDDAFRVSGTALHFTGGTSVFVSGSHAYINTPASAGGYYGTQIYRYLITGSAISTISVSGTSFDYDYLDVLIDTTSTSAVGTSDTLQIRFNGDIASTSYYRERVQGQDATVAAVEVEDRMVAVVPNAADPPEHVGSVRMTIPRPANTYFYKNVLSQYMDRLAAAQQGVGIIGLNWENTAAITSIVFTLANGSFAQGSFFLIVGYQNSS